MKLLALLLRWCAGSTSRGRASVTSVLCWAGTADLLRQQHEALGLAIVKDFPEVNSAGTHSKVKEPCLLEDVGRGTD